MRLVIGGKLDKDLRPGALPRLYDETIRNADFMTEPKFIRAVQAEKEHNIH
ncbi:MAG: hypothetical protein AB7U61_18060 [Methylocystis sp.]